MVPTLEEKAELALEGLVVGVVYGQEKDKEEVKESGDARKVKRMVDHVRTISSL